MFNSKTLRVEPVSGALGAEVFGVDLARPIETELLDELRSLWHEHLVLVFREQQLDAVQLLECARRFGEPTEYPFLEGVDGYPQVVEVLKKKHEKVNFGGVWHIDTIYQERPPKGAFLYAVDVPARGGDTLFANMYLAYERLSDGMKRLLEPLEVYNTSGKSETAATRSARLDGEKAKTGAEKQLGAWHPIVRIHPATGRRSLFLSPAHALYFRDMTEAESRSLLEYLWSHQIRPEHTCRLRWSRGSLALWDNRCSVHFPINDYDGYERRMYRVSLAGDRPTRHG